MWGIIVSALSWLMNWLFRAQVVKWVFFTALYAVMVVLIDALSAQLDGSAVGQVGGVLGNMPDGVLYFMGVFRFDVGLPMIISAMVLRFAIRRLPIIG